MARPFPMGPVLKQTIERASTPGTPGKAFALQLNRREVAVFNRCFRMEADAGGERLQMFSAFTSDPNVVPKRYWKRLQLEPDAPPIIVDDYSARLLVGLGVRRFVVEGVDAGGAIPGLVGVFRTQDDLEMTDDETETAAKRMCTVAAAVFTELTGAPCNVADQLRVLELD
jgi:hypothetical protein